MPEKVQRDGRTYTEYSPHELDQIRLDATVDDMIKRGRFRSSTEERTMPSTDIGSGASLRRHFNRLV